MAYSELEKRLAELEQEQVRQEQAVDDLTTNTLFGWQWDKEKANNHGFFIILDFGNNSPVCEWSEDTHGWRTQGFGTRYSNSKMAEKRLEDLKRRWPDYPLKLQSELPTTHSSG